MTSDEVEAEVASSDASLPFKVTTINDFTNDSSSFESKFLVHDIIKSNINYETGASSFCINSLVHHEDSMKAKGCIKREQDSGKTLRKKINTPKQMLASLLTKNVTHLIGKDIMGIIKMRHKKRCNNAKEKIENGRNTHAKRLLNVNTVIAK